MKRLMRIASTLGLLSALVGCGDESPTQIPQAPNAPARPTDLTAEVGEREVRLSWESSGDGISSHRVYRREAGETVFDRIAEPSGTSYDDSGLVPGRSYDYRVTAFGTNRIESEPSVILTATPGAFGLVIDARADYTADRLVVLTFTAPSDVNAVKLGADSLLSGAFFEDFEASREWLLPEGDGLKRVFAKFRTSAGIESPIVSDAITLDTRAEILSLSEDSEGRVLGAGDTLRVVMNTGEAGGFASISIGPSIQGVPLAYDAGSGTYRLERVVTPDLAAAGEVVLGNFVDRAGNEATARATTTTVTLAGGGAPLGPTILSTAGTGDDWAAIAWEASDEPAFSRYVVYRADDPGISGGAGDLAVGVVTDRFETGLVDSTSLRDSTTYFYRVFVEDRSGRRAGSNVVPATTRNRAPQAAGGFSAAAVDSPSTAIRLTWTAVDPSTVHDFAAYAIYRSTVEAVSDASELIGTVGEILTRNLVDSGAAQATTYYYRVYVVDRGGLASGSEVASATATDLPPSFVPLGAPVVDVTNQNVTLGWSGSPDPDFASYELFAASSTTQGGAVPFTRIHIINNAAATSYVHYPDVTDLPFYVEYYLQVVDRAGKRTTSNRVQAVFPERDLPVLVSLEITAGSTFGVVNVETDVPTKAVVRYSAGNLSFNRTASDADDFERAHSIPLESLSPSTSYYLQVEVEDETGATVSSPIRTFTTSS